MSIDNYHDKCIARNIKTICIMCNASMVMLKHECIINAIKPIISVKMMNTNACVEMHG